ncbi:MAG: hypothetical protein NTV86_00920 [Planctomycetota bacterium]|nr:hypothetical protein [Planctomycetota bacterium]
MARKHSDAPARNEVTTRVQEHETDMETKAEDIEETVTDVETERETLDGLELAGTAEGAEGVEQSIEAAGDVSAGEFDSESTELKHIQDESQEQEDDLHERSDTTSSDLGRISDASGKIHSDSANTELVAAKEAAVRDIEFLDDTAKQAQAAREQSQRRHEEHVSRVGTERRP